MAIKKIAFHTLGCKLNFAETSGIARLMEGAGFMQVGLEQNPDVFVLNTCSVTDNADKKCRKLVQDLLKDSPNTFVIVIGCYAQLKPLEIASIPGVDVVLGASEKFKLLELISKFEKNAVAAVHVQPIQQAKSFVPAYSLYDRTRTFLKVQDGCNYHCAFCTIPLARGKSRSGSIQDIITQALEAVDHGAREIVLTGVNIGDYGIMDGQKQADFLSLIQALDALDISARFRISSIEPNLLNNDIIHYIAQAKRFVPHFHIPLQAGHNELLKAMGRRYTCEWYADRIQTIKRLMPEASIGADVITGLPGETKAHFLAGYQFLNELAINYLHVFPYSERQKTRAIHMLGSVSIAERNERADMLRTLSEKKQSAFYKDHIGKIKFVLFEQEKKQEQIQGFTENYIRVSMPFQSQWINTFQSIQLTKIGDHGLMEGIFIHTQDQA